MKESDRAGIASQEEELAALLKRRQLTMAILASGTSLPSMLGVHGDDWPEGEGEEGDPAVSALVQPVYG